MGRVKFDERNTNSEKDRATVINLGNKRLDGMKKATSGAKIRRDVAARRHLLGDKNTEETAKPDSKDDLGR